MCDASKLAGIMTVILCNFTSFEMFMQMIYD